MAKPLWTPGNDIDKRLREIGEGVGETNNIYDETGPQLRVLFCAPCKTIEELPTFVGRPEDDVLLDTLVQEHQRVHPYALASGALLASIAQRGWEDRGVRRKFIETVWSALGVKQSNLGLGDEFYASRSTFVEDAVKCHIRHHRAVPCLDFLNDSKRIGNPTKQGWREGQVRVYLCHFPFRSDTEVVTRDGIRPIGELVGKPVDLLIPVKDAHGGFASSRGKFATHEVIYAGQQQLWRVVLRRGAATEKIVYTTAEHRWFVREGRQEHLERQTNELSVGARLQPLKATPARGKEHVVPFGVAQGFVFGDGSVGRGDQRPATVTFYADKDLALLPFFVTCQMNQVFVNEGWHTAAVGLPRHWKELPPIRESRSFLLSWLAGYFAADGTVDKGGSASISSSRREHLEFVRSVAAVCGVGTNPVRAKERDGFGKRSMLYSITLNSRDLPDWFWLIDMHRDRVLQRQSTPAQDRMWTVVQVQKTPHWDDVYCAVVEGVGAFALADDIMTGNCPVFSAVQEAKNKASGMFDK